MLGTALEFLPKLLPGAAAIGGMVVCWYAGKYGWTWVAGKVRGWVSNLGAGTKALEARIAVLEATVKAPAAAPATPPAA